MKYDDLPGIPVSVGGKYDQKPRLMIRNQEKQPERRKTISNINKNIIGTYFLVCHLNTYLEISISFKLH